MSTINKAYSAIADINLWYKNKSNDDLVLADIPSLIPLRWAYFRDNWEFIKQTLVNSISSNDDPDFFNSQIKDFSNFIYYQRTITAKINPFSDSNNFYRFYYIFNQISVQSINLNNEEIKIIENEKLRVSAFSRNNFISAKNDIIEYRDRLADTCGLSDDAYNTAFNKSSIPAQTTATIDDINLINTLQQSVKTIDFILANLFAVDVAVDPFAIARANANNPNINIGQYSSGTLVKINYGESLQSLANRYLGNPDKWLDIAIANGLKPPYIDEVGEKLPLLSNGRENQINLSETDLNGLLNIDKLYINQPVFLQSSTQVTIDQRTIVNIRQIPISGEIILELDGARDLDKYQVADNARIRVFKPNTINSSFYVLIPSNAPLDTNRKEEVPWFLAKKAEDEKKARIDFYIDDNNDLSFDTNGDLKLNFGIDNAIQAIKLKLSTELGTLNRHPNFGLVNVIGENSNNISGIKKTLTQSIVDQIAQDARFDRVEQLSVSYLVNKLTNEGVAGFIINLSVRLAGSKQVIPISFTINNT